MPWNLVFWLCLGGVAVLVVVQPSWNYPGSAWVRRLSDGPVRWYLFGFPATVVRMFYTWRRLCVETGLAVMKRSKSVVLGGDLLVSGAELRPTVPRLGIPRPTPTGLKVRVQMEPGQTPAQYLAAADAMAHAWQAHAVRVVSPRRGWVLATMTARDPLTGDGGSQVPGPPRLLTAVVGRTEDGGPWVMDFRMVPHWLVVGATRSGKSTLIASLVFALAPQAVALVGVDCKGGMELSLFEPRLSALARDRREAAALLRALVDEIEVRMDTCRAVGARSIWELGDGVRPVPLVVLVDEVAELYLSDGSREDKQLSSACSTAMLRLGQLGAALGLHLVVAGQRVGSELGPGVTALRAQLGGRICHRVNDEQTALMVLGDLSPDAVAVAQSIGEDEQGVAVTTVGGVWMRARSTHTTAEQARHTAGTFAKRTPGLPRLVQAIHHVREAA
ncbi:FtsK/SpoIIIE domain-containing protein [Actinacidiphila sp. DG2A-62]|uniref:FtsK/SpoIIIE domain-containing protein n=1 Tax=Actinacidiphila sp. DG2A-62 TaxID=3108821 RepID=UPI002DB76C7A|nr:FtsK/SpoIIIE domain-containing protein [Actinacidiphila sp. DG2A-62]MEC3996769.1 FtsK/SpoIIIE domain-containing protein [Actinacidiphila sp. DG2A-62]